jgi:hypothetical protein
VELVLELTYWLLAAGARFPRHGAAILTATAIPIVVIVLLLDSGVTTEVGTTMLISSVIGGIAIAVPAEGLGSGPNRWLDWSVVIVGAVLGLVAALGFVIFFGLFGTMFGLYAAATAAGAWLALRLAIAIVRMFLARRQRPA